MKTQNISKTFSKEDLLNVFLKIIEILGILLINFIIIFNNSQKLNLYFNISWFAILILYFIIRILQKSPIQVIKSKIDICVLILIISTSIPLIMNTYVSFYGSIKTIQRYIFVFTIYIFVREIAIKEKNRVLFYNLILTITVLLILIGIDGITSNRLENILNFFSFEKIQNRENRLTSIFSNPNVISAYFASVCFLNISLYLKTEKIFLKAFYKTITFIIFIGVILTYSKGVLLIFPIVLVFFILFIGEKSQKLEVIQNLFISAIFTIIYIALFERFLNMQNYILIWVLFLLINLINYITNLILEKYKLSLKKIIIFLIISFVSVMIFIIIGLNIYDEYKVFDVNSETDYSAKIINNIKPNENYCFEFYIESKAPKDIDKTFELSLIERDIRNNELNRTKIEFGTFNGVKNITLKTNETTNEIKIEFISKYPYSGKMLSIKYLEINKNRVPLKYKFLPTKLVEKIKNININYKTSKSRIDIIKDALNFSKSNKFIGMGGDAWRCKYHDIQSYNYVQDNVPSFFAKILLEFGLIGIISYFGIISLILFIILKKTNKLELITICFSFLMLIFHSSIDVDMENLSILVYTFAILGVLVNNTFDNKKVKIDYLINIILILISIICIYFIINKENYNKYNDISKLIKSRNGLVINSEKFNEINCNIAKKYEELMIYERYNELENYNTIIKYYLGSKSEDSLKILEKYYNKILYYEDNNLNVEKTIIRKIKCVYSIINTIEKTSNPAYFEIEKKYIDIIFDENKKLEQELEKCKDIQNIKEDIYYIEKIYEYVQNLKSNFLLNK